MKNSIKKILLAALLAACMLALTACQVQWPFDDLNLDEYVTLGEYKGLVISAIDTSVSEEQIDSRIRTILANYAERVNITDRPVQEGDEVNIDYTGYQDGEAFSGGSSKGYALVIGSNSFIDGFEDGLIGANLGDTVSVDVTFPNPYPANAKLSGAEVVFEVTINSISELILPEMTDAFVQEISDYDSVEAYRTALRASMEEEIVSQVDTAESSMVWTQVENNCTILKLPEDRVQMYYEQQKNYYESYAASSGMKLEDFCEQYMAMTLKQFDEYCKTYAENAVTDELIIFAIAEKENITLTNSEYKTMAQYFAEQNGLDSIAELEAQYDRQSLRNSMLSSKVMNFLTDNASFEE